MILLSRQLQTHILWFLTKMMSDSSRAIHMATLSWFTLRVPSLGYVNVSCFTDNNGVKSTWHSLKKVHVPFFLWHATIAYNAQLSPRQTALCCSGETWGAIGANNDWDLNHNLLMLIAHKIDRLPCDHGSPKCKHSLKFTYAIPDRLVGGPVNHCGSQDTMPANEQLHRRLLTWHGSHLDNG